MLLVIGGIKGGTGKTTIATNLTVIRAQTKKVLLVDADEQRSASDWVEQRVALNHECKWVTISLAGKAIITQLQKLKEDYDDIIVDTGGRDTTSQRAALACADYFLIPFKPKSIDVWTMGSVRRIINEMQAVNPSLKCGVIINQADARGDDNENALSALSECSEVVCLPVFLGNRKAFSNASADGLGVCELIPYDQKAYQEIHHLYRTIYGI